jgi:hypothetical protein
VRTADVEVGVADHIGKMLMQGAAQRDVDHLGATADPEYRHAPPDRTVDERELERVALTIVGRGLVGGRVRLLAVHGRVDIASAGDDQPVQPV